MASLDGRVIVAFDPKLSQAQIGVKLQQFLRAHTDRFIDSTNAEELTALLRFLPYSFTQQLQGLEGFQQWAVDALVGRVLDDVSVERVFGERVSLRAIDEQFGRQTPRWFYEHPQTRRTYAVRHLLSGDVHQRYAENEEELCAQLRRRDDVTFAAIVPTISEPYPDAKDSLLNIHAAHYLLRDLQLRGPTRLRARFPHGLPESPQDIEQFAELRRETEPILDGVCSMLAANDGARSEQELNHLTIPAIFRNMLEYNVAVYHILNGIITRDEGSDSVKGVIKSA